MAGTLKNLNNIHDHLNRVSEQVNEGSEITTKLCAKCYQKTITFYKFKILALRSDAYLQSLDQSRKNLSAETDDDKHYVIKLENDTIHNGESNTSLDLGNTIVELLNYNNNIKDDSKFVVKIENAESDHYESDDDLLLCNIKLKSENVEQDQSPILSLSGIVDSTVKEHAEQNALQPKKGKRGRKKKYEGDKPKKQVCAECGKAVSDLKEHSAVHLPKEERRKLECPDCDKIFYTYGAKKRHYQIKHLGLIKSCNICGKKVACLRSHIARMHDQSKLKYECSVCKKRFICGTVLDEHMLFHTKEKPFECDICQKKFRLKALMQSHKRNVHAQERTHLCQFCSKSFFKEYHLQVHLRRQVHEKEKSHLCQYCSKSFFKKHHLNEHVRSHTKERPYECAECGRSFKCVSTLKQHRLVTHSGEKNYPCQYCPMTFACANYLRTHMVSHTKEKKYECKYCGVMFGRSDHRNRHQYTAHEKHTMTDEIAAAVPVSFKRYYGSRKWKERREGSVDSESST